MTRLLRLLGAAALVVSVSSVGSVVFVGQAMSQTAESFRDSFMTVSYSGNNGTRNWSGSWQESGEGDGPNSGSVRVTASDRCFGGSGNCLRIGSDGSSIENHGARRVADLQDAVSATLSFRYRRETQGQTSGSVAVQISRNGGASWSTLQTIILAGPQKSSTATFDIGSYMASNTTVRFLGAGPSVTGYLHIDDIEVTADVVAPTTTVPTTTITAPGSTTTSTTIGGPTTTSTTIIGSSTTTSTTVAVGSTTTTSVVGSVTTTSVEGATTTSGETATTLAGGVGAETTTTAGDSSTTSRTATATVSPESSATAAAVAGTSEEGVPTRVGLSAMGIATETVVDNSVSLGILILVMSGLALVGIDLKRNQSGDGE